MAAFDAGSIEARLELDRTPFIAGLRAARAEGERAERDGIEIPLDVDPRPGDRGVDGFERRTRRKMRGLEIAARALLAPLQLVGVAAAAVGDFNTGGLSGGLTSASAAARVAAVALAALGAVIVALAAGVAALVASLAAATAGFAALATAGLGALVVAAPLAIFAMQRFKAEADKAGTSANALKRAGEETARVFRSALGPAIDAIFGGLAAAVRTIRPLASALAGPFQALGQAIGRSFALVAQSLASPAVRRGLIELINGAARLAGPITQGMVAFGRVLLNIAVATMPLLVSALRGAATWMGRIADSTSRIGPLRAVIAGLVSHLQSWLSLSRAVAGVLIQFFRAAAPAGQSLVNWLARGAERLRDWLRSASGQRTIRRFFEDAIPIVRQLVQIFGRLIVTIAELFQILAPGMRIVLFQFNLLLGVINRVLGVFRRVADAMGDLLGAARGMIGRFFNAGKEMILALGRGMLSVATTPLRIAKDVIGGVADILPGSEPKDPSSPLRRLDKRGEAMIANVARGIARGHKRFAEAFSRAVTPPRFAHQNAWATPGGAIVGTTAINRPLGDTYNQTINVQGPAGQTADPRAVGLQFADEVRRRPPGRK